MNRRSFLRMAIGGAFAAMAEQQTGAIDKAVKYFFAPAGGWDDITSITNRWITPRLIDEVFENSPLFLYDRSSHRFQVISDPDCPDDKVFFMKEKDRREQLLTGERYDVKGMIVNIGDNS